MKRFKVNASFTACYRTFSKLSNANERYGQYKNRGKKKQNIKAGLTPMKNLSNAAVHKVMIANKLKNEN